MLSSVPYKAAYKQWPLQAPATRDTRVGGNKGGLFWQARPDLVVLTTLAVSWLLRIVLLTSQPKETALLLLTSRHSPRHNAHSAVQCRANNMPQCAGQSCQCAPTLQQQNLVQLLQYGTQPGQEPSKHKIALTQSDVRPQVGSNNKTSSMMCQVAATSQVDHPIPTPHKHPLVSPSCMHNS